MSATGAEDLETDSDHAYFRAVEDLFIALRGAPLLLSPADWRVAQRWHQEGIPLDLVRRTLIELFARRKERGSSGRVSSLRYCAPAVEAAWGELRELVAGGERGVAEALAVAPRLRALASALPAGLPAAEGLAARITALGRGAGVDPRAVEAELSQLDVRLLAAAEAGLGDEERSALEAAVEETLGRLRSRLPTAEVEGARQRLELQLLRRRLGLPVLSLFSPEAEPAPE